ncbi:hypothetical protein [Vibrio sagamiensis]|nr:hypothetical protein [Vibrio sagamiensis]PNQ66317.1 transcriptional regulator [Vibrio agarivorans]
MQDNNNEWVPYNDIEHHKLPSLMQELIEIIGYNDMYTLVSTYGGYDTYIPKNPRRSKLRHLLPKDSLNNLSYAYGGTYLTLPTSRQIDLQGRNQQIIQALESGETRSAVAKRFGLGIRQVSNIKKLQLGLVEKNA